VLYAILCYNDETVTSALSKEKDDAVMRKLVAVQKPLLDQRRLGPVARLLPTTAATTLRKHSDPPMVLDGPFAETKEQLLGFYVVDCASLEDALAITRSLGEVNPVGSYEIRPIAIFHPGSLDL
jgi:hypothetical protein